MITTTPETNTINITTIPTIFKANFLYSIKVSLLVHFSQSISSSSSFLISSLYLPSGSWNGLSYSSSSIFFLVSTSHSSSGYSFFSIVSDSDSVSYSSYSSSSSSYTYIQSSSSVSSSSYYSVYSSSSSSSFSSSNSLSLIHSSSD